MKKPVKKTAKKPAAKPKAKKSGTWKKPAGVSRATVSTQGGGSRREESFSVRKIKNGWVTSHSWSTPQGAYRTEETYSKSQPKVTVPR